MKIKLAQSFLILSLVATFTTVGCQGTTSDKKATAAPTTAAAMTTNIKPADLNGLWMKTDYLNALRETHSPLLASEKLKNIAAFAFDASQTKGDSLAAGSSYNGHEGVACTVIFKAGKKPNSIQLLFEGEKLPCDATLENGELIIASYNKNDTIFRPSRYTQVSPTDVNLDNAMRIAAEQALFAGPWLLKNKTNPSAEYKMVQFGADDTLTNFPDFAKYDVLTDFMGENEGADQIYLFDGETPRPLILIFKHKGDSVDFFEKKNGRKGKLYAQLIRPKR